MKIAFMFPGQGSQYIGMGRTLYENFPVAKEIFIQANDILGFSLSDLMFSGSEEDLKQTQNTQPAILTHSIALWNIFKERCTTSDYAVIGHSLGEYSAYVASNRISFADAVNLVRKRGQFMSEVSSPDYGMAAILKLKTLDLEKILQENGENEVFIANDNCPGQIVISGLKNRIEAIIPMIQNISGRVIPLAVSGAFHSVYMKEAAEKLKIAMQEVYFAPSVVPLYSNVNALPIIAGNEKSSLESQVYSGVLFLSSIQNMIKDGFDTFIEVGPGKVLQGLVKKIDPNVKVLGIENPEDIEIIIKEIL